MKLTIIPIDGLVYENGLCYSDLVWSGTPVDVHALQWQDVQGWIEYNDGKPNEDITVLPNWAINAMDAWTVANTPVPPPAPVPPTAADNKATAQGILSSTDWTTIADVASPTNSPYLTNQAAFIAYRNTIRGIAVNPMAGNLTWPTQPTDTWSTV